jgi:[NiFe] hydrogenase assembly HybE family chaperone
MAAHADPAELLARRSAELVRLFESIVHTRMAGVPVLNMALHVEAVGFLPMAEEEGAAASGLGILLTPWFMNLVLLPLALIDSAAGVGLVRTRTLRGTCFEFIGAHEPAVGAFAACSLFSPVFEFADQATARATAQAVLAQLREPLNTPAAPARRSFLFGRAASAAAAP